MAAIVSLKNIVKRYMRGEQNVKVLHSLNLEVPAGRVSGAHGAVGLRQDDAPESDRRA